jgi:hypothetical protein
MSRSLAFALFACFTCALTRMAAAQFEVGRVSGHDQHGGTYVSADIDGETAVVGVPYDGSSTYSGAAYVFVRVAGNWIEEAKLLPSDPTVGGEFGTAVVIDGNRAFVGATRNTGNVALSGAVYLFRRTGVFPFATWTQQTKLVASDTVADSYFGWSIAQSGDTIAVGAPGNGGPSAAYVLTGTGSTWSEQAKLTVAGAGTIGGSVALDGDTLVLGRVNVVQPFGDALVFTRNNSVWSFTTALSVAGQLDQFYGYAVALDGDTAVVSSPQYDHSLPSVPNSGAVYAFFRQGGTWSAGLRFEPSPAVDGGGFGGSLAIEGTQALVGLPNDGSGGVVCAFRVDNGTATEIGRLKPEFPNPSPNLGLGRGSALALSGDLSIAGGKPSVIFSNVPPAPVAYCSAKVNSHGCLPAMTFQGNASASSPAPFLLIAQAVLSHKFGLLFFGVSGRTAFPFQGGMLCVLPPIRRTITQDSGGAAGVDDCSGTYSFDFNALVQSGVYPDLTAGTRIDCQYWSRDPASPSTTGLTDAIEFGIGF